MKPSAGWTTYGTGRAAFQLFQGHETHLKTSENQFTVAFQWERLLARNARFLPFPSLLRQCIHRSNPAYVKITPTKTTITPITDNSFRFIDRYQATDSIYKADLTARNPTFEAPLSTAPLPRLPTR